MRCHICGCEHDRLEPTFRLPDAVWSLSEEERERRAHGDKDFYVLAPEHDGEPGRFFVRVLVPVQLLDSDDGTHWSLWAELEEADARTVWEQWDSADQADLPIITGALANRVPEYPDTTGLPVEISLTGPTTVPAASFTADADHPFAVECRGGVLSTRVFQWLHGAG